MDLRSLKKSHYIISTLAVGGIAFGLLNAFPQPLLDSTDNFILLAEDQITLASDITVSSGDVGANSKKGILTVGSGNTLASDLFASRITLGPNTTINGNATFNNLTKTKDAEVLGEESKTFPSPLVDFPVVVPFQTGTEQFRTQPSETTTLQSRNFKSITTAPNTTLTLEPGVYNIETLTLGNDTTVHFFGATTINISKNATIGNNVVFSQPNTLPIDSIAINSTGTQLSIGTHAMTHGIITAPDATITLGQNTLHRGQVIGRHIVVGNGVILSREEGFEKESDESKIVEIEDGTRFFGNELLVLLKDEATLSDAQAIAQFVNGTITGFDPNPPLYQIELSTNDADSMIAVISVIIDSANPLIIEAIPNLLLEF